MIPVRYIPTGETGMASEDILFLYPECFEAVEQL